MRLFFLFLLVSSFFLPLSAKETEEKLAMEKGIVVRPTEPTLGELSEPSLGVREMMEGEYSLAWLDGYVDPGVKQSFAYQYGPLLEAMLPAKGAIYGRSVASGPYVVVPVRLRDGRYVTLTLAENKLVGISVSD